MKLRACFFFLTVCSFGAWGCGDPELYVVDYGGDEDEDGWPRAFDCDDEDPEVFPAADEIPGDGIDQDCSGTDEVPAMSMGGASPCDDEECGSGGGGGNPAAGSGGGADGIDADGDGYVGGEEGDDCDDARSEVHPEAQEIVLNGIDENCDGSDLVGVDQILDAFPEEAVAAAPPALAAGMVDGKPHVLAVWSDSRVAPAQDLYGQLFDAKGLPVGEEIAIDTEDNAAKSGVRVASRGDGFLVTWATASGVWVQRLQQTGVPRGTVLGYGGEGASAPVPAVSQDHWAVAWMMPADQTAHLRAMTLDGARGDILELGSGEVSHVALAPTDDGFVAVWEGPLGEERGVWGQSRTITGHPEGEPFAIYDGPASGPVVGFDGTEHFVAFRVPGNFGHAAGKSLGSDLSVDDELMTIRLSSESLNQSNFFLSSGDSGFFVFWNDDKHATHTPPAQAIYGNHWSATGVRHSASTAVLAASQAQLGGVASVENKVFLGVLTEEGAGLIVRDE